MFGRNRQKPVTETASGVPITVSHSTNRVGCRARVMPGTWFQNRQDEIGHNYPWVVVADLDWGMTVQAVYPNGEKANFRMTVANSGIRVR